MTLGRTSQVTQNLLYVAKLVAHGGTAKLPAPARAAQVVMETPTTEISLFPGIIVEDLQCKWDQLQLEIDEIELDIKVIQEN